jgi:nucleoside-diphosphate-sugar epimerase
MTVLLTGPTGAVGQYLIEQGLVGSMKLRVLALPETLHRVPQRNQLEIIPGDVNNDDAIAEAIRDVDTIFHTAVLSPPPARSVPEMTSVNTYGTRRLLEASAGRIRRFVFVSSVTVYTPHRTPDTWPVRAEAARLAHGNAQLTAYGQSLIDAEDLVFEACERYGMEYTIIRPTVVCGRNARFAEMVLSSLMRDPSNAEGLDAMWGTMQWVHGVDVARAALLASESPAAKDEAFIVAGNEAVNSAILLSQVWEITHMNGEPNPFAEMAEATRPPLCKFDTSKIADCLGWRPLITLRACLEELLGRYEFHSSASLGMPRIPAVNEFSL